MISESNYYVAINRKGLVLPYLNDQLVESTDSIPVYFVLICADDYLFLLVEPSSSEIHANIKQQMYILHENLTKFLS